MTATGVTPRQAQRRYVGLTALRWLPIGISAPVTVLLMTARGLTPTDIGLVVAVYGTVAMLLELPTGGLSDAIGHRPVLALSALSTITSLLLMVAADDVVTFAVAWGALGVGRALDSGPLEAWYVDAVHAAEPGADVTRGLSLAGAADGLGLSLGAVLGGLLPLVVGDDSSALAAPLLVAAGLTAVSLVAVLVLVVPLRTADRSGAAAIAAGIREVPRVVRGTAVLVTRDRVLRLLLVISFLTGTVLTALELIGPLHFADLGGGLREGTAAYGVTMAVAFAAAGLGALLAPAARRAARGSVPWASAVLSVLGGSAVVAVAVAPTTVVAAAAFAVFYLFNGGSWPLRQQLMHDQTTASQRSTTVSAKSFALMLGGLAGNLLHPRIAEGAGNPAAFLAAAAAMLLIAAVSLGLRPTRVPVTGAAPAVAAPGGPATAEVTRSS
ncbi:MFS transporter [Blastococcus sp. MG754426]|uniref:MFS transporter n=1 Tax=unclassified Blastococcus TaxID=2619396 RepID=UPI001EF01009|nr:MULTISPECIES: MFS transporter [unclassified Blastococcus]MCF6508786.1 MFS transporter [Blastococcus sp. MG754426]MCF6513424.1 MFS transporter [Blastococcus sp. MG754427]